MFVNVLVYNILFLNLVVVLLVFSSFFDMDHIWLEASFFSFQNHLFNFFYSIIK